MRTKTTLFAFAMTVTTGSGNVSYVAIAHNSAEAIMAAVDRFGIAKICAAPIRKSHHHSLSVPKTLSTPRGACAGAELIAYEKPKHAL